VLHACAAVLWRVSLVPWMLLNSMLIALLIAHEYCGRGVGVVVTNRMRALVQAPYRYLGTGPAHGRWLLLRSRPRLQTWSGGRQWLSAFASTGGHTAEQ
jgi:hypothetical protein